MGGGEENDESHFYQECWRCGIGDVSGGVLGGGLGLTGKWGNGFGGEEGRETVESFRARETLSTLKTRAMSQDINFRERSK